MGQMSPGCWHRARTVTQRRKVFLLVMPGLSFEAGHFCVLGGSADRRENNCELLGGSME